MEGETPQGAPLREVSVAEAPGGLVLPFLQPPRILTGLPPSDQVEVIAFGGWLTAHDGVQRQQKLIASGYKGALSYSIVPFGPFLRTLAKIAHAYDVANVGITNSDNTLNKYILREDVNTPYLVGGTLANGPVPIIVPPESRVSGLHQIYPFAIFIDGLSYVAVQIRLFAQLRPPTPVYTVVMRRHRLTEGDPYFTIVTKK